MWSCISLLYFLHFGILGNKTLCNLIFCTQVDPFLQLIEDYKLQAVNCEPDDLTINYGSKEDDHRALDTLSELSTSIHQTQERFASEIIKSWKSFSNVELWLLVCVLAYQKVNWFHIFIKYEPLVFYAGWSNLNKGATAARILTRWYIWT